MAEQGAPADRLEPTLVPRFGFRRRLSLLVMPREGLSCCSGMLCPVVSVGRPEVSILYRFSAPRLVVGGAVLTCVGIASYFQRLFPAIPATILGLLIVLGASLTCAWRAGSGRLFAWGIGLLVLGWLALAFVPINIHGWTGILLLPLLTALLIGALFVVAGTVRLVINRVWKQWAKT